MARAVSASTVDLPTSTNARMSSQACAILRMAVVVGAVTAAQSENSRSVGSLCGQSSAMSGRQTAFMSA